MAKKGEAVAPIPTGRVGPVIHRDQAEETIPRLRNDKATVPEPMFKMNFQETLEDGPQVSVLRNMKTGVGTIRANAITNQVVPDTGLRIADHFADIPKGIRQDKKRNITHFHRRGFIAAGHVCHGAFATGEMDRVASFIYP